MGAQTAAPRRHVLDKTSSPPRRDWLQRWQGSFTAGAASFVLHLVLVLILACLLITLPRSKTPNGVTVSFAPVLETELDTPIEELQGDLNLETQDHFAPSIPTAAIEPDTSQGLSPADLKLDTGSSDAKTEEVATVQPIPVPVDREAPHAPSGKKQDGWSFPAGTGFEGRQPGHRTQLALMNGGTLASESAVEAGLEWLARHQQRVGSWSLQFQQPACGADCSGPGAIDGSTAATGLALLCFLGAGHTHQDDNPWRENVQHGLEWLAAQSRDGDLRCSRDNFAPERNSGMYAQGIAAMAICEALGMTHDRMLLDVARDAVRFIVDSQDPAGGGWRYEPLQRGDTSVLGWEVMALISARMSGLEVPDETRERTVFFLQSMLDPATGRFGYTRPARGTTATTAIGQLCSMYLRSSLSPERLRPDVSQLAATDPLNNNEYANYYISQVLHQFGGDLFKSWNERLREGLIQSQRKYGHSAGSWDPRGPWGRTGGRLYTTSMHLLTLEVYYRHLPLYHRDALDVLQPRVAQRGRHRDPVHRQSEKDDEPAVVIEPMPDGAPVTLADPNVPRRYILNYPAADRFCGPVRSTFEEVEREFVPTDRGRFIGPYPNGGFGLPMLQVGDQTWVHTGADYGWHQAGDPVYAVASGIVRLSVDPALIQTQNSEDDGPNRSATLKNWGSMVVIEHRLPDGEYLTTLYAHLDLDRRVRTGDIVAAGQQIGVIGPKSADVNGGFEPHLHFGIRQGRIAESGATLFTANRDGQSIIVKLREPGEETMTVQFPEGLAVPDALDFPDNRTVYVERREGGEYHMPSWLLWQTIPPEARLAGYLPDLERWLDPTLFLRDHGATVLPAARFTMTLDPDSGGLPNMAGEPAPGWIIDDWIRAPAAGTDVTQLRGKTVVMLCVQNNCQASQLLALPMFADAARRFADNDDVVLILHQTAFTDFRFNTSLRLRQLLNQLPPSIAVAHSGNQKSRPVILDDYGIRGTPWTLIIGPDGVVEFSGCLVDSNELIRMIGELSRKAAQMTP